MENDPENDNDRMTTRTEDPGERDRDSRASRRSVWQTVVLRGITPCAHSYYVQVKVVSAGLKIGVQMRL